MFSTTVAFEYKVGNEQSGRAIKIPKGYVTDADTIPKWAWSLIGGPLGRYSPAAVVHDFILQFNLYPRKRADEIFYEALGVLGIPYIKRKIMYAALRVKAGWNKLKNWYKGTYEYTKDTDDIVH